MSSVSIIIPVYNVEKYIDKCIESLVNQTFTDIEMLIVNDGSTDKSDEKCRKWAECDTRIVYISKENQGPGPTRNLAIKTATSEFVTFCDSDDWYDEYYIELMLAKQRKDNADIVICSWNDYDDTTNEIIKTYNLPDVDYDKKNLINLYWKLQHMLPTKLIKRSIFIEHGIKLPACLSEDTAIHYYLMTVAKKISIVPLPLYNYTRNRTGSIMNSSKIHTSVTTQYLTYSWDMFINAGLFDEYKEPLLIEAYKIITSWYEKIKDDNEYAEKWLVDVTAVIQDYFGDLFE